MTRAAHRWCTGSAFNRGGDLQGSAVFIKHKNNDESVFFLSECLQMCKTNMKKNRSAL